MLPLKGGACASARYQPRLATFGRLRHGHTRGHPQAARASEVRCARVSFLRPFEGHHQLCVCVATLCQPKFCARHAFEEAGCLPSLLSARVPSKRNAWLWTAVEGALTNLRQLVSLMAHGTRRLKLLKPRSCRGRSPHYPSFQTVIFSGSWHLCGWIKRIPGEPRKITVWKPG